MWPFGPKLDATDPKQLATAVHELGHAWAWKDAGLDVYKITTTGATGATGARYRSDANRERMLRGYAVGCWAGFEAEDRWLRENGYGTADLRGAAVDIENFHDTVREMEGSLSERKARRLARSRVARRWRKIQKLAPKLAHKGRISI